MQVNSSLKQLLNYYKVFNAVQPWLYAVDCVARNRKTNCCEFVASHAGPLYSHDPRSPKFAFLRHCVPLNFAFYPSLIICPSVYIPLQTTSAESTCQVRLASSLTSLPAQVSNWDCSASSPESVWHLYDTILCLLHRRDKETLF